MTRGERCVLVCYDIPDDVRRGRVSSAILRYGSRLQYSVFVVTANALKLRQLHSELAVIVSASEDSILVVDLGTPASAKHAVTLFGVATWDTVAELPAVWSV